MRYYTAPMRLHLPLLASALLASPAAFAENPAGDALEVPAAQKAQLKLLSDGKSHYVALIPFGDMESPMLYGDGKTLYAQRTFGGGSSGDGKGKDDSFDRYFWEPRANAPADSSLEYRGQKYLLTCETRKTELHAVPDAEAAKILDGAKLMKARWQRRAYALARDNTGKYYYVDRAREPENNNNFRLYVGKKGGMKLQKMTNVVSDSAGDIFATKSGSLRLILNKNESLWQVGGKKEPLILLPIEDNHVLIYSELGVYTGQPLGTPCDDL